MSNPLTILKLCSLFTALSLRLQGPLSPSGTGRLEIFHKGQWGTICSRYYWYQINIAKIACRQLGYQHAVRAFRGARVQDATGIIWLQYVNCNGKEQSISSCYHSEWGVVTYCNHEDDIGIECSGDLDECYEGLDNCVGNSQCINTVGSFTCRCSRGYTWNGITCTGEWRV